MALKGTLRDFGIAEILQLVGQQQKSGSLRVKSKEDEVLIGFKEGVIVKAESVARKKRDLIGNRLVRAELITEAQLESALDNQKRTLRRLGDVLVSTGAISQERFAQMVQLQAQEAIYQLFGWKSGSYAFEPGDVEHDPSAMPPMRAEAVLMDGFRMVDEWPMIRKTISNDGMAFEVLKALPAAPAGKEGDGDDFGGLNFGDEPEESQGDFQSLGSAERRMHGLVRSGRDVRKLLDLSCLSEFDTLKALTNLLNLGYLKALPGRGGTSAVRFRRESAWGPLVRGAAQAALVVACLAGMATVALKLNLQQLAWGGSPVSSLSDPALARFASKAQVSRIESALEVYRAERGEFPETLQSLVTAGLLRESDLRYPWKEVYAYRRTAPDVFVLLPPLH